MTLTQLKKDIQVGSVLSLTEYIYNYTCGKTENGIPEKMKGNRTVTHKDTTGFYLNSTPKNKKRGSFCGWPKASEMTYNGNVLSIKEKHPNTGFIYNERTYTILN